MDGIDDGRGREERQRRGKTKTGMGELRGTEVGAMRPRGAGV